MQFQRRQQVKLGDSISWTILRGHARGTVRTGVVVGVVRSDESLGDALARIPSSRRPAYYGSFQKHVVRGHRSFIVNSDGRAYAPPVELLEKA